LIIKTK